jgi:1-acyl-sn-glycerol-3-phosphate acyltransferase
MGLFHAAVRAGVAVVPVALHGTGAAMAKGAPDIGRREVRRVHVRVGRPLAPRPDGSRAQQASDLCERTRASVVDMHRDLASTEGPPS